MKPEGWLQKWGTARESVKPSCRVRVRQFIWANADYFPVPFMKVLELIDTAAIKDAVCEEIGVAAADIGPGNLESG